MAADIPAALDAGNKAYIERALISTAYTDDLKQAEAARYVHECLLVHPYIEAVSDVAVCFDGGTLDISCIAMTVYAAF